MSIIVKSVKGYEGHYTINEYGKVFSLKKNKYLKAEIDKDGYLIITLTKNSKSKKYKAHRLVAENFLEDFDAKDQVNHKDFIKSNNHYTNLEKSNHRHNQNHKWNKNGTKRYGVFKHKDKWRSWLNIGPGQRIELGVSEDKEFLYEKFYQCYLNYHGIAPWIKNPS